MSTKLTQVVDEVERQVTNYITPVSLSVSRPQGELFNGASPKLGTHVSMGDYYEMATQAIYGGTVLNHIKEGVVDLRPDVLSLDRRLGHESKANAQNNSLVIRAPQAQRYTLLQRISSDSEIVYVIFRHTFKGIMRHNGGRTGVKKSLGVLTERELFDKLGSNTHFALVLPLSVVMHMMDSEEGSKHDLYARYGAHKGGSARASFDSHLQVRSKGVNYLASNPFDSLRALNLNPDDYNVTYSALASPLRVEGATFNVIPVVKIEDVDKRSWIEKRFGRIEIKEEGCSDELDLEEVIDSMETDASDVPF